VLISVFGALGWQGPSALIKVDFAPVHGRDFTPSLTGDNQHAKVRLPDFGETIAGVPDFDELVIGKYSFPRPILRREL
jgi:hypothetical protein